MRLVLVLGWMVCLLCLPLCQLRAAAAEDSQETSRLQLDKEKALKSKPAAAKSDGAKSTKKKAAKA